MDRWAADGPRPWIGTARQEALFSEVLATLLALEIQEALSYETKSVKTEEH
jgi:hypothetical protein